MEFVMHLALLDFEEVALLLVATSWLMGTAAQRPARPLAAGEQFITASGAEVASLLPRPGAGVFNGCAWTAAAARASLSRGCALHGCGIRRDGELQLSLAFRLERRNGLVLAFPLTDPLAQYTDLAGRGDALALLQRSVRHLSQATEARALILPRVRSDSELAHALAQMGSIRLREGHAPFIDLTRHACHEAWLASFGAATRKSRRQRRRRLEAQGVVGFRTLQAGPEAGRAARDIMGLKRSWMQASGLRSRVLDDEAWSSALLGIVAEPDSGAAVSCLTLDGRLIAGEIGFMAGRAYHAYLGAYDRAFAGFGVGTLQIVETVRWCFEAGLEKVDFLPPDDSYKRGWTRPEDRREVADHILSLDGVGMLGASLAAVLMTRSMLPAGEKLRGLGFRGSRRGRCGSTGRLP